MFHCREANKKINNLYERSLRLVYKDNNSSFKDLIKKNNSFTVHHRNIQSLTIELLKVKENISNTIMNDILQTRTLKYNFKVTNRFSGSSVNTSHFGLNSLSYFASKVWKIVPSEINSYRPNPGQREKNNLKSLF